VALKIYKSGQGRYVRLGTGAGAGVVALALAYYVWGLLAQYVADDFAYKVLVEYAAPAVVFVGLAVGTALALNRPKVADFLIATESEMKKVSWSSRAELFGSTTVVIVTVFLLALVIYIVDYVFIFVLTRGLGLW